MSFAWPKDNFIPIKIRGNVQAVGFDFFVVKKFN